MALHKLASIAVRPRRDWRIAALSVAALTAAGCSHNRQSYRPIYASPAPVAAALHQLRRLKRDRHDRRTGDRRHGQLRSRRWSTLRRSRHTPLVVAAPAAG